MKDQLRVRFRAVRDAIGPEQRAEAARRITEALVGHPRFVAARNVLLYASFGSEVDTRFLRDRAWADGKSVFLPRIEGKDLRVHQWVAGQPLQANRYGIPEPLPDVPMAGAKQIDVVVVPGLAFDDRGGRLGYGGGYYDRLLASISHAFRVAICYSKQVVPGLPSTLLDAPMDCLITEAGVKQLPRRPH